MKLMYVAPPPAQQRHCALSSKELYRYVAPPPSVWWTKKTRVAIATRFVLKLL